MHAAQLLANLELSRRTRRHRYFLQALKACGRSPVVLDVGGTLAYWKSFDFPQGVTPRIVLLNTFAQESGQFEALLGDARDLSRFADRQFDIVFSNSVIGHVGGFSDQLLMASEVRRVGSRFFVQAPNHAFPIDWRTLVPFFHRLPARVQAWCFLRCRVGRYQRAKDAGEAWEWATRVRNLRRHELAQLFPGATVLEERVLGFTKSFIVHNFAAAGLSDRRV